MLSKIFGAWSIGEGEKRVGGRGDGSDGDGGHGNGVVVNWLGEYMVIEGG